MDFKNLIEARLEQAKARTGSLLARAHGPDAETASRTLARLAELHLSMAMEPADPTSRQVEAKSCVNTLSLMATRYQLDGATEVRIFLNDLADDVREAIYAALPTLLALL